MNGTGHIKRHLYCANPACGRALDWAAPVSPRARTPADRVHVLLSRSCSAHHLLCYGCGHYTAIRPIAMLIERRRGYVEIVAETDIIDSAFLNFTLDEIVQARLRLPGAYLNLLLEVVAPKVDVTPLQALDVFRRAVQLGLRGSQVAYVISGRPWSAAATLIETIARTRGVRLRFFLDRRSALDWLDARREAGRSA